MLTQRIGKSANEFQTMEGVSPEAVFLLGKDLNSFKEIARGLLGGSSRTAPGPHQATPRPASSLEALIKLYEQTRTEASAILGNLQGLVSAREAQTAIIADSEPLRRQLEDLQTKLSKRTGLGSRPVGPAGPGRRVVLLCAAWAWSRVQLLDSRLPPGSCRTPPEESQACRSRKPSASTTPTRPPFCV